MALGGNEEGADVFWPGYVDAVTNLVLNLLFMLTVMIVAVFMFALELSRHKGDAVPVVNTPTTEQKTASNVDENAEKNLKAKDEKIEELEQQIENLRKQVLVKNDQRSPQKVVTAKTPLPDAEKGLKQTPVLGGSVVVDFMQDAVTLTEQEQQNVRTALQQIANKGAARVAVDVPAGFSEAKRIGYYRVMAVRNTLIEMGVPQDKIEVSVREGKVSADNSKVIVSGQ